MIKEVQRCNSLGIPYLVTHLGSHRGTGEEKGIKRLVDALNKVAEVDADVTILLENTAGQKNSVGSNFEQWSEIFSKCKQKNRFGVCFDTCHAFAAGYDLRKKQNVEKTLKEFDGMLSDYGFYRVHQSHLINIDHLKEYVKIDGGYLKMYDGSSVPISTRKKSSVLKLLQGIV